MEHIYITKPVICSTTGDSSIISQKLYDFEVRRSRDIGGYWATCKEIHANTQAPTMKQLEKEIIDCANLMFECMEDDE
jgi:hypothetical protein